MVPIAAIINAVPLADNPAAIIMMNAMKLATWKEYLVYLKCLQLYILGVSTYKFYDFNRTRECS